MSVLAKVASFACPPATNHAVAYTGVGFAPKAILLFGNARFSDGATGTSGGNQDMPINMLGMGAAGSTGACIYNSDDFSSGDAAYDGSHIYVVHVSSANGWSAQLVSLDADGFTLDWTVTGPNAGANVPVVNYMALGGSSLSAKMVAWTTPTTASNKSFTGAGFQPEALVTIGGSGVVGQCLGFGITDGTNQAANSSSYGGNVGRYQRTNKCYAEIYSGAIRAEAGIVSLDSDGATFNFTTAPALSDLMTTLCLRGAGQFKVGSFNLNTSTGNQSVSGFGFQPVGMLISSIGKVAGTTVDANRIINNMSAVSGTAARGTVMLGDNNDGVAVLNRAKIIDLRNDNTTPSVLAQADLVSFDVGGFTFNISSGATAVEMIYLAVGASAAGTLGPSGTPVLEAFNRANGALGSNWSGPSFGDATAAISSNAMTTGTSSWNAATFADAEVFMQVPVLPGSGNLVVPMISSNPTSATPNAYAIILNPGSTDFSIYRYDAGSATAILSQFQAFNAGDWVGLTVRGGVISAWRSTDGTTWTRIGSVVDKTYTPSGWYLGVRLFDSTVRIDNFGGGVTTVGPSSPILDVFNRANGGLGSNWSGPAIHTGVLQIASNRVTGDSGGSIGNAFWNPRTFGPAAAGNPVEVFFQATTMASQPGGSAVVPIILDSPTSPTANGYAAVVFNNLISLYVITGGGSTNLGNSGTLSLSNGTWVRMVYDSAGLLSAYTSTDLFTWTLRVSATNTTHLSKTWYAGTQLDNAAVNIDNFAAGGPLAISTKTGAAALTGAGALSAVAKRTRFAVAALTGAGALAATGTRIKTGAAALSGSGALSASGTVTAGHATVTGAAALTGTGSLTATGTRTKLGAASLAGAGALTSAGLVFKVDGATLHATGTLTASGTVIGHRVGQIALSGTGALSASGTRQTFSVVALHGTGALVLVGRVTRYGAVTLPGHGALVAVGTVTKTAAVALAGHGALIAAGTSGAGIVGEAELTGVGLLVVSGHRIFYVPHHEPRAGISVGVSGDMSDSEGGLILAPTTGRTPE